YRNHIRLNSITQGEARLVDAGPLLEVRPDLRTLPIRDGSGTQLDPKAAETLDRLSRQLRVYLNTTAPPDADGTRSDVTKLHDSLWQAKRGKRLEWLRAEAIPTMLQLLMHEDRPVRQMLVELLGEIPGTAATVALARRAVFDLDPGVREAAVEALKSRPSG